MLLFAHVALVIASAKKQFRFVHNNQCPFKSKVYRRSEQLAGLTGNGWVMGMNFTPFPFATRKLHTNPNPNRLVEQRNEHGTNNTKVE